ncbi:MAG: tetratricopeptide repeat protein [Myxococcota bacterium]
MGDGAAGGRPTGDSTRHARRLESLPMDGELTDSGEIEALVRLIAAAPPIEPTLPLRRGDVVGDSYRVEDRIGAGGMGVVYRATDLALGRPVALKLHRRRPDSDRLDRLMREASVMARMSHPHVVTIFEVGQHRDSPTGEPRLFIAMEYVDGGSVGDWAKARARSVRAILDVFLQAGEGLAAAHAAGVVHRDLKPENILIDALGRARVADFGLARLGPDVATGEAGHRTQASGESNAGDGTIVGTPAYMAPEQWRGEPATAASDQYAFCVSLYELLYGDNPLATLRAGERSAAAEPTWTPQKSRRVPKRILRALRRGLSHDPAARFDGFGPLLTTLREDPRKRPLQVGTAALVVAVSGGAVWAAADAPTVPCDGGRARLVGIWDDTTQGRLTQAFEDTGVSYARESWARTQIQLDHYVRAWLTEHRQTCEATRDGYQSDELMDLRMGCLAERLEAVAATVEVLSTPDETTVRRAPKVASKLPSLSHCRDARALREATPIPAHQLHAADAVVADIARASANVRAGKTTEGMRFAEAAVAGAETLGRPRLIARAQLVAARASSASKQWDRASEQLHVSLAAAVRARDDGGAARALTTLYLVEGVRLRTPDADRWGTIADAWIDRLETQPEEQARRRAQLESTRGLIARHEGHYEEALERFQRAAATSDNAIQKLAAQGMLAETHRRAGDLDSALAIYERLLPDSEAAYGGAHPDLARELNNAGAVYVQRGEFAEARARFERALDIREAAFGPQHPAVAESLYNLGTAARYAGELDEATGFLRAALAANEESVDPQTHARLLGGLGSLSMARGHNEEAAGHLRQAIEVADRNFGPGTPETVRPRYNLAVVRHRLGQLEPAYALADEALEAMDAAGNEDARLEMVLYALRGKLRADDDPEAGIPDLKAALARMEDGEFNEYPYRFEPLRELGEAMLVLKRPGEALAYLREAKAEVTSAIAEHEVGYLYLLLARAKQATSDRPGAHADAVQARALIPPESTALIESADALVRATAR